jgi:hypothetical protein
VRAALVRILAAIPDSVDTVRKAVHRDGVRHEVVKKLADLIARRARALERDL